MKSLILSLLTIVVLASCTNYGKKVSQDYLEVYYKDGITKEQAQKTLDFIYPVWKDKSGKTATKSIQLTKGNGDTINFHMVIDKSKLKDVTDETFYNMGNVFSDSLFNKAPVNIILADDHFKDIRTLAYKKPEVAPEEKATVNANDFDHDVAGGVNFYWKGISDDESKTIADYIVKNGSFSGENAEIYMTKEGDRYVISFPVQETSRTDPAFLTEIEKISKQIKDNVFADQSFSFAITDEQLKAVKTWDY
jgi:hypothetical protein